MFSMSRPSCARMLRPSAETTPADTVDEKPSGLPMATHSWPTLQPRRLAELRRAAGRSPSMRMTAVSVAGSAPHSCAACVEPSVSATSQARAAAHHVGVRQDVAVGREEHAGAGATAAAPPRTGAPIRLGAPDGDADDGGADGVDDRVTADE